MNKGIEGIDKVLLVGTALCESIREHRARGESWGAWDFVQDVGPDLVAAAGALPDLQAEFADLDKDELIDIISELSKLLIKTIETVAGGTK